MVPLEEAPDTTLVVDPRPSAVAQCHDVAAGKLALKTAQERVDRVIATNWPDGELPMCEMQSPAYGAESPMAGYFAGLPHIAPPQPGLSDEHRAVLTFYRSRKCVTGVKKKVEDRSRWPKGLKTHPQGRFCWVCEGSGVEWKGGKGVAPADCVAAAL